MAQLIALAPKSKRSEPNARLVQILREMLTEAEAGKVSSLAVCAIAEGDVSIDWHVEVGDEAGLHVGLHQLAHVMREQVFEEDPG
jgi:hypothetical protein